MGLPPQCAALAYLRRNSIVALQPTCPTLTGPWQPSRTPHRGREADTAIIHRRCQIRVSAFMFQLLHSLPHPAVFNWSARGTVMVLCSTRAWFSVPLVHCQVPQNIASSPACTPTLLPGCERTACAVQTLLFRSIFPANAETESAGGGGDAPRWKSAARVCIVFVS